MDKPTTKPAWMKNESSSSEAAVATSAPLLLTPSVKRLVMLCLCFCMLCHGFAEHLTIRYSVFLWEGIGISMQSGSLGYVYQVLGAVLAALVYGFTVHRMNRTVSLLIACLVSGTAYFATPLIHSSVWQFDAANAVSGVASAVIEVSCIAWVLELWSKKSGPAIHLLVFALTLGDVLGAIVPIPGSGGWRVLGSVEARFAHKIAASALFFATAFLALMHGTRKYQQLNRRLRDDKQADEGEVVKVLAADGSIQLQRAATNKHWHKVLLVVLGIASLALAASSTTHQYLYNYAPRYSMSEITVMMSVSGIVSCVLLAATAGLLIKVPAVSVAAAATAVCFAGNMLLLFATASSRPSGAMLWAGDILAVASHALILPSVLSIMEQKVNVTDAVVGVAVAVDRLARMLVFSLVTYLVRSSESRSFVYVNLGIMANIAALLLMMYIMGKRIK